MKKSSPDLLDDWGRGEPSALEQARRDRLVRGLPVDDFITARPHDHGFQFDEALLKQALSDGASLAAKDGYRGEAAGWMPAREAVAAWHGGGVSPADVLLTPGTSLAYYYLFRLLARHQGEVLCPAPTYPLFDDIARLAGLRVRYYHLQKTTTINGVVRWQLDADELRFQVTPHTVAIIAVSPHNPTGSVLNPDELDTLASIARHADVPVIVDGVFRHYQLDGLFQKRLETPKDVTWITLDGISKSHYLPGIKAGWIVVQWQNATADKLRHGLEYISDTFLPVSDGIQKALPALLGDAARREVHRLAAQMRDAMESRLRGAGSLQPDRPEAGPYLCIPLPEGTDADGMAMKMLKEQGALFHPGRLYRIPEPCLVATAYNPARWPA